MNKAGEKLPEGCGKSPSRWYLNSETGKIEPSAYPERRCGACHKPTDGAPYTDWYCHECMVKEGLVW